MYESKRKHVCVERVCVCTRWHYEVAKTHRIPQKSPMISGSFMISDTHREGVCVYKIGTVGWRRPIGCRIFIRHFPQKSPMISGSFT